jgi:hypothetical protein
MVRMTWASCKKLVIWSTDAVRRSVLAQTGRISREVEKYSGHGARLDGSAMPESHTLMIIQRKKDGGKRFLQKQAWLRFVGIVSSSLLFKFIIFSLIF